MKQDTKCQPTTSYNKLLETDEQLSKFMLQLIDGEDIGIYTLNLLRDICFVILRNNWSIRIILRKYQEAKDYKATNHQRIAAKNFVSAVDFNIILTSAIYGRDNGGRAADFANLIVVIAASDETIARSMATLIRNTGYQPFDYDGDYLEG